MTTSTDERTEIATLGDLALFFNTEILSFRDLLFSRWGIVVKNPEKGIRLNDVPLERGLIETIVQQANYFGLEKGEVIVEQRVEVTVEEKPSTKARKVAPPKDHQPRRTTIKAALEGSTKK